jgi:hypothetical protein
MPHWVRRCRGRNYAHASSFSRGAEPPRFASLPSSKRGKRSADRRSGAAAPVGGRVTYARRRVRGALHLVREMLASRRSTAGFMASGPTRHSKTTCLRTPASFSRPLVVAEGGIPSPPGSCLQGNARDTASRPTRAMPRESTLGGRDDTTVAQTMWQSSFARCELLTSCSQRDALRGRNVGAAKRSDKSSDAQKSLSCGQRNGRYGSSWTLIRLTCTGAFPSCVDSLSPARPRESGDPFCLETGFPLSAGMSRERPVAGGKRATVRSRSGARRA